MKICNTCKIQKNLEDFGNDKRNINGKVGRCRVCQNIKNKENRERLREAHQRWKEKNPDYYKNYEKNEKRKEYTKKYYQENSQLYKDRKKQWRIENPEREAEARKNILKIIRIK